MRGRNGGRREEEGEGKEGKRAVKKKSNNIDNCHQNNKRRTWARAESSIGEEQHDCDIQDQIKSKRGRRHATDLL